MKLLITGSRSFSNYELLKHKLDEVIKDCNPTNIELVHGCAKGADSLANKYAELNGIKVTKFPAKWDQHGKSAGYIRNSEMLKYCKNSNDEVIVVAFWDGESKGTHHMIQLCKDAGFAIRIINFKFNP